MNKPNGSLINFFAHPTLKRKFKTVCVKLEIDMTQIFLLAMAQTIEKAKTPEGRAELKEEFKKK